LRRLAASSIAALCLVSTPMASAYGWPLKPFRSPHPIRGTFGDPRFHLSAEGALSAFHFGVDIAARDGTPVYAVEPGVVLRRYATSVTIGRDSGRRFGYWHIRPIVRSGAHVRLHQLLGHVLRGWGHVHFSESFEGRYIDPLRKGALTPFIDHTVPTVSSVQLLAAGGSPVDPQHVTGAIDVRADIYDLPPLAPASPWEVSRLAPAAVWWNLLDASGAVVQSSLTVSFDVILPANALYDWIYAPGTYQNKPHRPGRYLFWVAHALDTTAFPNGTYMLQVEAADTRHNVGVSSTPVTIANP
jgi:murein DD-endopeptidase MepM/ murein hydrolase activator NlpD